MRRPFSIAACLMVALTFPVVSTAQTVDEIVAKNLKAKGGVEKWKSISSVKMTGTFSAQGMEGPMSLFAKRPNLSRQEITMNGRKLVQAFDGTTPWMILPDSGMAREMPAAPGQSGRNNADFDAPLMDYQARGQKIERVGNEQVAGTGVD